MARSPVATSKNKSVCDKSTTKSNLPFTPRLEYEGPKQAFILSAYFYGYFVMNAIAAFLVHVYGPRLIMLMSLIGSTLFTFLIVPASYVPNYHFHLIVASRIGVGVSCGALYASCQVLLANWVPPYQRTILPVGSHSGNILGLMLALSTGVFTDISAKSWEYYTYFTGVLGIISTILWAVFVYDQPWEHPLITEAEKKMLIDTLHPEGIPKKETFRDIPFRAIFTSPHVYLTSIAHLANNFILYMLLTNHPKYLKTEYGAGLRLSSTIPIIAFACNTIAQIPFSIATQYAQKVIKRPETFFRKVNGVVGFFGASFFLLPIGFTGCSMFKSEIYIVLCMIFLAANQCAFFVGMINLSRKYAAIVMGFSNSIASIAGFVSPFMVSTYQEAYGIHDGWTYAYITTAVLTLIGGSIWLIFGSCEPQSWGISKTVTVTQKDNESIEVEPL